jgi:hypothetical protein
MNDEQIRDVFGALARIEEKLDSNSKKWIEHAKEHADIDAEVLKLRLVNARRNGILEGMSLVGSALGAGIGYAAELFRMHK